MTRGAQYGMELKSIVSEYYVKKRPKKSCGCAGTTTRLSKKDCGVSSYRRQRDSEIPPYVSKVVLIPRYSYNDVLRTVLLKLLHPLLQDLERVLGSEGDEEMRKQGQSLRWIGG